MCYSQIKSLMAAAVASLAVTGAASAADMAVKARPVPVIAYNWTGAYIGGFVGGAGASRNAVATEPVTATGGFYNGNLLGSTPYGLSSSFLGGVTIGYNWQTPGSPLVWGLEGEAGYLRLRGSRQDVNAAGVGLAAVDSVDATRIGNAYGIVAGRLGWANDRALFYVKGGAAFVDRSHSFTDACLGAGPPGCGGGLLTVSRSGATATYALGGGLEYAFNNQWTIKAEYLYLGEQNVSTTPAPAAGGTTYYSNTFYDPGIHTGKIGLNYRFNAPVAATY